MATLTDSVHQALHAVIDPDFNRSVVELGLLGAVEADATGRVSVQLVLATPAHPLKADYEARVRAALGKVSGVTEIRVQFESDTHRRLAGRGPITESMPGVSHVIAVSSGKGGVGKSTTAVNLACALMLEGAAVGLLDADVYGPNIPTMLGVNSLPEIVRDAEGNERFVPPMVHGIKVMSMGLLMPGNEAAIWRGPQLHSAIQQLCFRVDWGKLDYLVVDMPPGTGDVQLSLSQLVAVRGAVLVTTPQEVSTQDVRKAFHMFGHVKVPVLGLVENMAYFEPNLHEDPPVPAFDGKRYYLFGQDGGKKLAKELGVEFLAEFPLLPAIREGGDRGLPVSIGLPSSPVAQAFRALARRIAHQMVGMANAPFDASEIITIGRF